jgi:hypothetical protein
VLFNDPLRDLERARIGNARQLGPRTTVPRGPRIGARLFPVEFPVERNKQPDEFASEPRGSQDLRQLGEVHQPVRILGRPVGIVAVGDALHRVVRLPGLLNKGGYARGLIVHFIPSR